jgi:hypothetical protein
MLAYVVDAYRRGKSEDVILIPVSIAYDQIQDVGDYVAEQRGAAKERESFGWFLRWSGASGGATARSTSASASRSRCQGARRADPSAEPNPTSAAWRAEARLRGVRADQPGDADHPTSLVTLALLGVATTRSRIDETRGRSRTGSTTWRGAAPDDGRARPRLAEGVRAPSTRWSRTASSPATTKGPSGVRGSAPTSTSPRPTTATRSSTSS